MKLKTLLQTYYGGINIIKRRKLHIVNIDSSELELSHPELLDDNIESMTTHKNCCLTIVLEEDK